MIITLENVMEYLAGERQYANPALYYRADTAPTYSVRVDTQLNPPDGYHLLAKVDRADNLLDAAEDPDTGTTSEDDVRRMIAEAIEEAASK